MHVQYIRYSSLVCIYGDYSTVPRHMHLWCFH